MANGNGFPSKCKCNGAALSDKTDKKFPSEKDKDTRARPSSEKDKDKDAKSERDRSSKKWRIEVIF